MKKQKHELLIQEKANNRWREFGNLYSWLCNVIMNETIILKNTINSGDFEILLRDEWCKQNVKQHKNIKYIALWKLCSWKLNTFKCAKRQQWQINTQLWLWIIIIIQIAVYIIALHWLWMHNGVVKLKIQQKSFSFCYCFTR